MPTTPDPRDAVEALKEAMTLLARAGELLPRAKQSMLAAIDHVDFALMIAVNEVKLAEDEAKEGA